MKVLHNNKKLNKFKINSDRKPYLKEKYKDFCMYIQLAESCDNAHILSQQPWKWRKIHKLVGDKKNQYAFGIAKKERTTCYGNDRNNLSLIEVTELEIISYCEDYH